MIRKQIIGAVGAAAGIAVLLIWFHCAAGIFRTMTLPRDDAASRLAFTCHWLVMPGLTLLVGIWAAARLGFDSDAIDGTRFPESRALEINLRYNQNTVEQVILAAIAWSALSLQLRSDQLYLVPASAVSFVVGRAAFWVGYLINPMGRAFGMVVTILPTICAYAWIIWHF